MLTILPFFILTIGVTRIKPRSTANAHDQHLDVPNINTPWKSAIKRLVHNTRSVNSVSLLSKARPANKHDYSKANRSYSSHSII